MALTDKDINKLASLARIKLSQQEKKKFGEQLSSILQYVEQINEVDTSKVEEVTHYSIQRNIMRNDEVDECDDVKTSIEQFPERFGNLNKVKPVLGNEKNGH